MPKTHKKFAVDLARQAGKIMRANFALAMERKWKKDGSPVTETDLKINKLVIARVKKYFPEHGILGEEESYHSVGKKYLWVCDPVDGTVPFSHGIPTFVFSLALVKNGKPILGVIYDAMLDHLYVAEAGKGAFMNGKKISVNKSGLKNAVAFWDQKTVSHLVLKYPKVFWLNLYSICYEGITVAKGHAVAAFYDYHFAHDIAAIKILVEEAGGRVTDRSGSKQRYDGKINGALISNGAVHDDLLKMIKKYHKR
jgi:fructose-1,6-bisphosphatase/inositol monophosphatase family enzyme